MSNLPNCPATIFHTQPETIQPLGVENLYKCSCGCLFQWEDAFHWMVLEEMVRGVKVYITLNLVGKPPYPSG